MIDTSRLRHDSDINRLLRTFRHQPTDRVPNFEYLIDKRNVEAILGRPAGKSWDLNARDYIELVTRIGMDAIGGPIFLKQGQILGRVPQGALKSRDDLKRLTAEGVVRPAEVDRRKLDEYFTALRGTSLGAWAHLSAGLTQVYDAIGFESFCLMLYDDLPFIEELLEMVIADNLRALEEFLKYDFSFIHLGDDLGHKSGLIVPPDTLRQIWLPRIKREVEPIRRQGLPVTFHSDGKIVEAISMIIELGFCSLNPIEPYGMDIYDIKRRFGDKLCLVGNMDIAGCLAFGTPEEVEQDVKEHIDRLAPGGGYVAATSHSVVDGIPPENFIAMVAAIHKYGKTSA